LEDKGSSSRHKVAQSVASRVTIQPARKKAMQNLLTLNELAAIIGRRPETIKKDLKRNPLAVPPRMQIPGTRLLRWRANDVSAWLAEHIEARHG